MKNNLNLLMGDIQESSLYYTLTASTPKHLGVLEAKVLKDQIYDAKRLIRWISRAYFLKGFSLQKFKALSKQYEYAIDIKYITEMKSIASNLSNISYEDILLQNTIFDILYGHVIPTFDPKESHWQIEFGCTSFAMRDSTQKLQFVQTFDFWGLFQQCLAFIRHSNGQTNDIFGLRMGATLSLPIGMSAYTSALVNVVKTTVEGDFYEPISIRTRRAFEESKTLDHFTKTMLSNPNTVSNNFIFCDRNTKKIVGIESNPSTSVMTNRLPYAVKSNTYMTNSLQKHLLSNTYSKKRQTKAEIILIDKMATPHSTLFDAVFEDPINRDGNIFESSTLAYFSDELFGFKLNSGIYLEKTPLIPSKD